MFVHGINIPDHKLVHLALQRINGIGQSTATQICSQLCISPRTTVKQLPEHKTLKLSEHLTNFTIGSEKHKEMTEDIVKLVNIGTYRGIRLQRSLPVRGQRTRTNAVTAKRMNYMRTKQI